MMLFRILASITQKKFNKLIDIVVIINMHNNLYKWYIFHDFWIYASDKIFIIKAMINTKTIYNLIAKNLIKKYNIFGDYKVLSLMGANIDKIRLFKHYYMVIKAYKHDNLWTLDEITILSANIIGYKLILSIS